LNPANCFAGPKLGSISSLRCQISRTPQSIRTSACEVMFRGRYCWVEHSARLRSFELRRGSLRYDPARLAVAGAASEGWWSQTGSNRRPHACKARALPAELWPRTRRRMPLLMVPVSALRATTWQPSPSLGSPSRSWRSQRRLVGLGRLELPTSRLSSARSNQLSYKPLTLPPMRIRDMRARHRQAPMHRTALSPGACSSAKKEKRRRRNPANAAQQS
jgi:hypothetical protein